MYRKCRHLDHHPNINFLSYDCDHFFNFFNPILRRDVETMDGLPGVLGYKAPLLPYVSY